MKQLKRFGITLILSLLALSAVQAEVELLEPNVAFSFNAETLDANTLRAQWNVANDYYIYRDKIKFSSATDGIQIGTINLPKGKIKEGIRPDGTEGPMEVYFNKVVIDIPIIRDDPKLSTVQLIAKSQGCAEIGVCYPPHKQQIALTLPTAETPSALSALSSLSTNLGLNDPGDEILAPDQAFQYQVETSGPDTIVARWHIADGHYLYQDKFKFSLKNASGIQLGAPQMPPSKLKQGLRPDGTEGEVHTYWGELQIRIPLLRSNTAASDIEFVARYQGCSDIVGICYPPIKKTQILALSAATLGPGEALEPVSEQDQIAASLTSGNTLITLATFFGLGLLLAFTPCVFPMIPILSGIIMGQGERVTTRYGFIVSLTYVLAMALTYTIAGVFAGLLGENLQAAFQNPWVLGSFAAVFVALALAMFGLYDLQMPSFLQNKLSNISNRQKGGTLTGVAIMGLLSALIVGPCVAAPLAGALIYIGQTGDALLGGLALFALSMGMGAPLIVLGTSAGKLLPKAGAWMTTIKAVFGVMMLGIAIWLLERILPESITMTLWAVLIIVTAIYLNALEPLHIESTGWAKLFKGVGLVLLVYGVLLMIGVATGARDMAQPLKSLAMGGSGIAGEQGLLFKPIKTPQDLETELALAGNQDKIVMLDFYADWCIYCKDYEKDVFPDPRVRQALANAVLLRADVTANDDRDKALLARVGVIAPPAILFFNRQGKEQRGYRLVGPMDADEFLAHVQKATS